MVENEPFNSSDVMVILVLWFFELINFWIKYLCRFTFAVLYAYSNFQWVFSFFGITLVFVVGVALFVVGIAVGVYGHKYTVSLVGLCLCTTVPFIAVFTCITKFSLGLVPLVFLGVALFVICPASYTLIFNQKLQPIRRQARLLVSFCDFITILFGKYLGFVCIPQEVFDPDKDLLIVIVSWVVIGTVLSTLIMVVRQIKNYLTGDFVIEKGFKELMHGIRQDFKEPPSGNGQSAVRVTFFILLLLPAISISGLDEALNRGNYEVKTQIQNPQLKHIVFSTQALIIPLMEIFISIVPYFNERTREMMVLAWVHFNNVLVVSLFIYRMEPNLPDKAQTKRDSRDERETDEKLRSKICVDKTICKSFLTRPGPDIATWILIVTASVRLNSNPPIFNGGKESDASFPGGIDFVKGRYRLPGGKEQISLEFTYIQDKPINTSEKPISGKSVVTLFENKQHVYLITPDNSTYSRIDFRSMYFEVMISRAPKLIFFNLFIEKLTDRYVDISEQIIIGLSSKETQFEQYHQLPEPGTWTIWDLPVGSVQANLTYYQAKTHLLKTDNGTFQTEPFSTYLSFLYGVKALQIAVFKFEKVPPEQPLFENLDATQKTIYSLFGAGLGVSSVGYTHFFWVESPLRLRAFLYALLRLSIEVVRFTISSVVSTNFTRSEAFGLLLIQLFTTIWHLALSWIFHTKIHPDFG